MATTSAFVVSLDLELFWGVHDVASLASYGDRVRGVRAAVDALCERFERWGIHATWATVGLLMAHDVDDARAYAPDLLPAYDDASRSPYAWLDRIRPDERDLFFGADLVSRVRATPHQEIASHTFSHFYALESGAHEDAFRADLRAARRIAQRDGEAPTSLVFPRNQYGDVHLRVAAEEGYRQVRGNPRADPYRPRPHGDQRAGVRLLRLLDAHVPLVPIAAVDGAPRHTAGTLDVPASRFLRPHGGPAWAGALKLRRILAEIRAAVEAGRSYHLWWHPHNFGTHLKENLVGLEEILRHVAYLRDRYGLVSRTMAEMGEETRRAA